MNRSRIWALAVLAWLMFALGVYRLGILSFGFDEGFTVYVARMPLADEIDYLTTWDAHPPLHYFLIHFWIKLAGDSEFAARLPGVAITILLVPLLYHTARLLTGNRAGLLVALVGASNAFLIYYVQQARMYGLATVFSLAALYFTLRTLRRGHRAGDWIGLLIALLLSLYTLYYTVFPLAFVALVVVASAFRNATTWRGRLSRMAPYLALSLAAAALYAPWLPSLMAQAGLTGPGAWRSFVPPWTALYLSWQAMSLGSTQDFQNVAALLALLSITIAALLPALCALWRRYRARVGSVADHADHLAARDLLTAWLVSVVFLLLPLGLVELASLRQPIFHERYITVLVPAFALIVGIGLTVARHIGRSALVMGLLVLLGAQASALYNLHYDERFAWDDFRAMVGDVRAGLWPGDVILLSSGASYPIFKYYFPQQEAWRGALQSFPNSPEGIRGPVVAQIGTVNEVAGVRLSTPEDAPQTPAEVEQHLARVAKTARRVWYLRVFETVTDRDSVVHNWLDQRLFQTDMRWYRGMDYLQLYRYATLRPGRYDLPAAAIPADFAFTNGAAMRGYELQSPEPKPGELTTLSIYWQARSPIARDYQVFVHLVDHDRRMVAQSDGPPLSGRYPTSLWQEGETIRDEYALRLPADLPPGVYHVVAGMYDLASLRRVSLAQGGDSATIGELVVHPSRVDDAIDNALASFGPIELRRFAVDSQPANGQVALTLRWKAIDNLAASYKVFVHLLAENGQIVAQQDREPLDGAFPTSKWHAGDIFDDRYSLAIPKDVAAGAYRIAVGFYDPQTLRRLDVPGNADGRAMFGPFSLAPAN